MPICNGTHVVKNGKRADGVQKYHCKNCTHHFVLTSNSVLCETRKNLDTWIKFINYTLGDKPFTKTAKICGIYKNTALSLKHKSNEYNIQRIDIFHSSLKKLISHIWTGNSYYSFPDFAKLLH